MIVMFGVFWIYGWSSEIRLVTSPSTSPLINFLSQTIYGNFFVLTSIFTVVGFGLLFSIFTKAMATGLFTSIFIVSFTIIISPFLQKFWFNVLITDFHGTVTVIKNPDRFNKISMGGLKMEMDFYNLKIALSNAISQLVIMFALLGKLSPPQIGITSLLFNFS